MDFRKSEATRYIAASVLSDSNLRNEILKCDREKHLADPPEPGIDISLIVKMSKFADNYDNKHALAFFSIFVSMLLIILEYFLFTKVKYYGLLLLIALLFLAISVGKKNINKWLYYYFTQVKHEPEATDMPLLVKMRKLAETYYNKYDFMFLSILAIVVAIVIYFLSQWSITTILVFIILLVLAIRISFKMERMKIQWLLKYFTRSMYDPEKIEKELLKNNDYGLNTNRILFKKHGKINFMV